MNLICLEDENEKDKTKNGQKIVIPKGDLTANDTGPNLMSVSAKHTNELEQIVLNDSREFGLLQLTDIDNDNTNGTMHEKDGCPSLASIEVDNLVIDSDT